MEEITDKKTLAEYRIRFLWLFIGLLGSLLISKFIDNFKLTLERNILIATFIPLVVYMSDAVGTQMESMIIRAISKEKKFKFMAFFSYQFFVVFLLSLTFGLLSGVGSYLIYDTANLSITLGLAVTVSIISSLITGLVVPYTFWRFHQDPAEASGPIATIIQYSFSVLIYFFIVTLLM